MKPEENKGSWISRAFSSPLYERCPMLADRSKIRDLVLIEDSRRSISRTGLNVLTGEMAPASLSCWTRWDWRPVRALVPAPACGRARHRAPPSPFSTFPEPRRAGARADNGIPCDGEIILRRTIAGDGRTRAFVNDEAVGIALLREIGALLVEIHGQGDDRGLFDSATHRRLLDAFGGLETLAAQTAQRFAAFEAARTAQDALRSAAAASASEAEFLLHAVRELGSLGAEEGEEAQLAAERALLMNAGRIAEDVATAIDSLAGDKGAEAMLAAALKRLARLGEAARTRIAPAEAALEQAFALAEDARRELSSAGRPNSTAIPRALEAKEERLFALRAAARKYSVPVGALPQLLADYRQRLAAIEGGDEALNAAARDVERTRLLYRETASALSEKRAAAAASLEAAVAQELRRSSSAMRASASPSNPPAAMADPTVSNG